MKPVLHSSTEPPGARRSRRSGVRVAVRVMERATLAGVSGARHALSLDGMTRRLALILVLLAALLAGGWFAGAELLKRRIADWTERQRQAGITVEYRFDRMRGFPFAVTAELA